MAIPNIVGALRPNSIKSHPSGPDSGIRNVSVYRSRFVGVCHQTSEKTVRAIGIKVYLCVLRWVNLGHTITWARAPHTTYTHTHGVGFIQFLWSADWNRLVVFGTIVTTTLLFLPVNFASFCSLSCLLYSIECYIAQRNRCMAWTQQNDESNKNKRPNTIDKPGKCSSKIGDRLNYAFKVATYISNGIWKIVISYICSANVKWNGIATTLATTKYGPNDFVFCSKHWNNWKPSISFDKIVRSLAWFCAGWRLYAR